MSYDLLSLSEAQIATIHQGAETIPQAWRERYFAGIQDALLSIRRQPDDSDVQLAVHALTRTLTAFDDYSDCA